MGGRSGGPCLWSAGAVSGNDYALLPKNMVGRGCKMKSVAVKGVAVVGGGRGSKVVLCRLHAGVKGSVFLCVRMCVCVCVCQRERERERESRRHCLPPFYSSTTSSSSSSSSSSSRLGFNYSPCYFLDIFCNYRSLHVIISNIQPNFLSQNTGQTSRRKKTTDIDAGMAWEAISLGDKYRRAE